KMRFEARKVIGNVRKPGVAASAAEVYDPPIVVVRASGTCVVPLALQRPRPPQLPTTLPRIERALPAAQQLGDLIITAAIVGAELTRPQNPYVPYTPQEIADEAARCREAGAAVIHLHARHDDGRPTQDRERFARTVEAIRQKTDVVVQVSTGGAVGMS